MQQNEAVLRDGGAVDLYGVQIAEFPLEPMMAKMLLGSAQFECSHEVATIAAMLQVQHVFVEPPNKRRAAQRDKYV